MFDRSKGPAPAQISTNAEQDKKLGPKLGKDIDIGSHSLIKPYSSTAQLTYSNKDSEYRYTVQIFTRLQRATAESR